MKVDYIRDVIYSNQCPLSIEAVGGIQKRNKLRWFGYVERKGGGMGEEMNVHGWCKAKREAKMIWLEVVENNMKVLGLASAELQMFWTCHAWRKKIVPDMC